jgi:hypothetical protein
MPITSAHRSMLDALSTDDLRELNHIAVEILKHRRTHGNYAAARVWRPRDYAQFTDRYGRVTMCRVEKVNITRVQVVVVNSAGLPTHQRWMVGASALKPWRPIATDVARAA